MVKQTSKFIPDLKARREARGWTVADLARIAGIQHSTVKRAEDGKGVHPDSYRWIMEALDA